MVDVILDKAGTVNHPKLDGDIKAAIGDVYTGHGGPRNGKLILHFTDSATDQDKAQAQSIALSHDPLQLTTDQQLFENIKTTAQSAVGVALNDLTQGQIKALFAITLFNDGAVDDAGAIRPLADWARKRR